MEFRFFAAVTLFSLCVGCASMDERKSFNPKDPIRYDDSSWMPSYHQRRSDLLVDDIIVKLEKNKETRSEAGSAKTFRYSSWGAMAGGALLMSTAPYLGDTFSIGMLGAAAFCSGVGLFFYSYSPLNKAVDIHNNNLKFKKDRSFLGSKEVDLFLGLSNFGLRLRF